MTLETPRMATPREAYDELVRRVREISLLGSCSSLLHWDREAHMPPKGAQHRAAQHALLAGMCHEQFTDPKVGELIAACEGTDLVADPLADEAVNVRELRRAYDRATKLPRDLVEEIARVTSLAHGEWVEARKKSDFGHFQCCLKGPGNRQTDLDCLDAHMDIDGDIDQADLAVFLNCMRGAKVSAAPGCAD